MEAKERQYYALLTIFGALFGIGPFIMFEAGSSSGFLWGCFLTLFGLVGLLMLYGVQFRRGERIGGLTNKIPIGLMGVVGVWILLGIFVNFIYGIRTDLDTYVMPRTITEKQSDELRNFSSDFSSHHQLPAITLKVNPQDQEAIDYWQKLGGVFNRAKWKVEISTTNSNPDPSLNPGLCIYAMGKDGNTSRDPEDDPRQVLTMALRAARIETTCGGGGGSGEYKLFLLVGHRPLRVGNQAPWRIRIAQWLEGVNLT
jgi:hypothetical protein